MRRRPPRYLVASAAFATLSVVLLGVTAGPRVNVLAPVSLAVFGLTVTRLIAWCTASWRTPRRGSVLAEGRGARAWLFVPFALGVALVLTTACTCGRPHADTTLGALAAVISAAWLLALDGARLARVATVTRGLVTLPRGAAVAASRELDLGIGHARHASPSPALDPYRSMPRDWLVKGDVRGALMRISAALLCDAAMLGVSALLVGAAGVGRPHECGVDTTRLSARVLRSAAEVWRSEHEEGRCPTTDDLLSDGLIDRASKQTDRWGDPYVISCDEEETTVHSWGPNRVDDHGFGDDVRVPERP
jgi:hypothetical protein